MTQLRPCKFQNASSATPLRIWLSLRRRAMANRRVSVDQRSELYRERVLLLDIGFAVALGLFCLAFWRLAVQQVPSPIGVWFCIICGTAGLLYGLFDVCEDITLRALLQRDRPINNLEAGLASVLTRFKMVAICVSVVGVAVFLLLSYAFKAAFELMRR